MKTALAISAAVFGLTLVSAPASALPSDRGVAAPYGVEHAAYGCRRGFAPDRRGVCRPIAKHRHGYRNFLFGDTRPAPMWRQNARERAAGCAYGRTPRGIKYMCQ